MSCLTKEEIINTVRFMKMGRIYLIFLTIIFLCANAAAQNNVGNIIYLRGTARLKPVKGRDVILHEKSYARSLQPNQKLKVDKNGKMQIWLCNNKKFFIPTGEWYTVPANIICLPSPNSRDQQALEESFSIGARHPIDRHRGENSFILFPIESKEIMDIIRPETAMFRWSPSTTAKLNLSVSVIGAEDEHWEKNDVSGEEGSFTSDDLKKFLKDVREKHPDARLQLKIKTSLNTENTAIFQLLSEEKDKALQQELASLKEENGLLLHLFRAGIYYQYKLFIESAGEYEEALKLSPESIGLLNDTAVLEELAGNLARSEELQNHIDKLSKKTK